MEKGRDGAAGARRARLALPCALARRPPTPAAPAVVAGETVAAAGAGSAGGGGPGRGRAPPKKSARPANAPPLLSSLQGPGVSDQNLAERVLNLVTTAPYAILAARHAAAARTPERRVYAASLAAVTACATAFHATSGRAKELSRKADVWAIAGAAAALSRVLHPKADERRLTHVALALTPLQPFAVIGAHAAVAEVEFARGAIHEPDLRAPWRAHVLASALGLTAWCLEDVDPSLPFMHCAWHVLSAVGMGATEPLVARAEERLLAKRARRRGGAAP